MRKRVATGLLAAALGLAFVAFGPVPRAAAAPRTITYPEALRIALERNLSLLLAANDRAINEAAVSDAVGRFLPDLRLGVSGNESFDKTATDAGGSVWDSGRSLGVGLTSGVTLFDGGSNLAGLRGARFERAAGDLDYDRARQTVVFQVITDYLALVEATEQERVRRENLAAQEAQDDRVRALVEEGERPISELYQQESNVAAARLALVEATRSLELSSVDLVQTLQLDPREDIVFAIPPTEELASAEEAGTFAALAEVASRQRADLAAQGNRLSVSGTRVSQAKAGRWPTLSLSGSFSSRYSDSGDGDLWGQLDDDQSAGIGLSLSYPIFDRMQTRNDVRRAEIAFENAEIGLAGLRQDVLLQVRRAVLDRDAARESLDAATARARAAREALSYTNERYLAGASTLFEVTLSRADLVAAESGEISARYRLLWQNRLVDYYVGTLEMPPDSPSAN